jgi:hypothetical protein
MFSNLDEDGLYQLYRRSKGSTIVLEMKPADENLGDRGYRCAGDVETCPYATRVHVVHHGTEKRG